MGAPERDGGLYPLTFMNLPWIETTFDYELPACQALLAHLSGGAYRSLAQNVFTQTTSLSNPSNPLTGTGADSILVSNIPLQSSSGPATDTLPAESAIPPNPYLEDSAANVHSQAQAAQPKSRSGARKSKGRAAKADNSNAAPRSGYNFPARFRDKDSFKLFKYQEHDKERSRLLDLTRGAGLIDKPEEQQQYVEKIFNALVDLNCYTDKSTACAVTAFKKQKWSDEVIEAASWDLFVSNHLPNTYRYLPSLSVQMLRHTTRYQDHRG